MQVVIITSNVRIKSQVLNCFSQFGFSSQLGFYDDIQQAAPHLKDANYIICDEVTFKSLVSYVLDESATKVNKQVSILKANESFSPKVLLHSIMETNEKINKITLPIKNGVIEYQMDDILFFENIDRHIYVHTTNDVIRTELSLKELKTMLEGTIFFSPYVSYYVNLSYIKCINANDVVLQNGELIPLSQKKASVFRERYRQYVSILSEKQSSL